MRPPNSQEYTNTFVFLADVADGSEEKRECGKLIVVNSAFLIGSELNWHQVTSSEVESG